MIKRKLQVILVENGTSIKIGEGELGVRVDSEERFGTVVRLIKGRIGEPNSGFFNLDLDLSEKTIMAFRKAIEESPEDPLAHLLAGSEATPAQPEVLMAIDRATSERTMLIEIHPGLRDTPSDELLQSFKRRMFDNRVFTGLFITPNQTQVFRDLVNSREFEDNAFHRDLVDTENLLAKIPFPEDLSGRVRAWLICMSTGSWGQYLPQDAYLAMVPFVVGNLAGAVLEDWDARE